MPTALNFVIPRPLFSTNFSFLVTLVANPPLGENGQCCEMFFPGPPPGPTRTFLGGGATLRCK